MKNVWLVYGRGDQQVGDGAPVACCVSELAANQWIVRQGHVPGNFSAHYRRVQQEEEGGPSMEEMPKHEVDWRVVAREALEVLERDVEDPTTESE